ncbi:DUF6783 domain-containing protein [Fusicatenibacter sp.]
MEAGDLLDSVKKQEGLPHEENFLQNPFFVVFSFRATASPVFITFSLRGSRMRTKQTAKWGLQIAEIIFQTRSKSCLQAPFELQIVYRNLYFRHTEADKTASECSC